MGDNYYRLHKVDRDGSTQVSQVVHLVYAPSAGLMKVFPNPALNQLTVSLSERRILQLEVYDMLGQRLFQQSPNLHQTTLDLSGLSAGNYFLQVRDELGEVFYTRFLKSSQ